MVDGHDLTCRPPWTAAYWTRDEARTLLGEDPGTPDCHCYNTALFSKAKVQTILDKRRKAEEAQAAAEAFKRQEHERREHERARLAMEAARMRAAAKLPPVPKPKPAPPMPASVASLVRLVSRDDAAKLLGRDPLSAGLTVTYENRATGIHPAALRAHLRGEA